jgi:hypothetical protein
VVAVERQGSQVIWAGVSRPDSDEFTLGVEDLDASVVDDEQVAVRTEGHILRLGELAWPGALGSQRPEQSSLVVPGLHAPVAEVGVEQVALAVDADVARVPQLPRGAPWATDRAPVGAVGREDLDVVAEVVDDIDLAGGATATPIGSRNWPSFYPFVPPQEASGRPLAVRCWTLLAPDSTTYTDPSAATAMPPSGSVGLR